MLMGQSPGDIHEQEASFLLDVVQELSFARELPQIGGIVRRTAREILAADGVTFVLREQDSCVFTDEEGIAPLWKGQRLPASACLAGWAMTHREPVVIEDIHVDPRAPQDMYSNTCVRSLAIVPIRPADPLGAIGVYWAKVHRPSRRGVALLEALAAGAATAMANAELYRQLQEAIRLRDELLEVAAHELRTPLTPLRLELDRLSGALVDGRPTADFAARIAQSRMHLTRLERLVERLLDQSRMWSDRLVLERAEGDLVALVEGVVARARPRADRARCPLLLETEGPVRGAWDAGRLEQAIESLIDNALKFGQGAPVEVRVSAAAGLATVSVRDHGIGVPESGREQIFERFARGVPTSHFGGFGLGLWIARRIVSAHGGTISVDSRPHEGATFHVCLPLHPG